MDESCNLSKFMTNISKGTRFKFEMKTQNTKNLLFAGKLLTINKKENNGNYNESTCCLTPIDEFNYLIDVHVECSSVMAKYNNIIDNTKLFVNANRSGAINPARNHPAARLVQKEAYIPKALEDKRMFLMKSEYDYTTIEDKRVSVGELKKTVSYLSPDWLPVGR